MSDDFLVASYGQWHVFASLLIASLSGYATLDLVKRVRYEDGRISIPWWIGGALAMGTGIWSQHFVGMLGYQLPIDVGYMLDWTIASWLVVVAVSALALYLLAGAQLSKARLAGGAVLIGGGIAGMHYMGMASLDMQPGIQWDWALVALSVAIAVAGSGGVLRMAFWLTQLNPHRRLRAQLGVAVMFGLAIATVHFVGMAAASFPVGSICRSAGQLSGSSVGEYLIHATMLLLGITLLTSTLEAHLHSRTLKLASRLQDANDELRHRAFSDPLTGLPNRTLLEDRLRQALARANRLVAGRRQTRVAEEQGHGVAVMFIDLDGFKPINDSLGHAAGDTVLKEVAQRLLGLVRDCDTVARLGGDEFVVLVEEVLDQASCSSLAQRLVQRLAEPIELDGKCQYVNASVGIAMFPDHGPGDRLIAHADAAMYAAKRAGGSSYVFYRDDMNADASDQLNLQNELRHALARGELALHYQPKFESRRNHLRGVEALLRWQHPSLGWVSPAQFIPVAERFGLINALGDWVIEEACRQMRNWLDQGIRIPVAINLSVHQLRQPNLAAGIAGALDRYRVDANLLLCEITESVAMEDIGATQRTFEQLSRIGVYLSIDDFGTGYSSLAYLRQLPARQLKIDRSFIMDIEQSPDARAVVDAVIRLAHALGLSVVAEGVETAGQRDILKDLACDEMQGYLFARPMPADTVSAWVAGQGPADAPEFSPSAFNRH